MVVDKILLESDTLVAVLPHVYATVVGFGISRHIDASEVICKVDGFLAHRCHMPGNIQVEVNQAVLQDRLSKL